VGEGGIGGHDDGCPGIARRQVVHISGHKDTSARAPVSVHAHIPAADDRAAVRPKASMAATISAARCAAN
jgi:hypothetical protein